MKILLIQSSLGDYKQSVIFPLGLACLAAALDGHDVEMLDLNIVKDPEAALKEMVDHTDFDVIGLSFRNIDDQNRANLKYFYRENFQQDLRHIRQISGALPLVVGGTAFSLFPEEIMEDNPEIDFGVYLEGEQSFPELLDNLHQPEKVKGIFYRDGKGKSVFTGSRPLQVLTDLASPRRDLLDLRQYTPGEGIGIQTHRGCCNECSYCVYPFLGGHRLRLGDVTTIVDQIQELVERYGIRRFFFADSSFGIARQHAEEICREILRRQLDVHWGAYFDMTVQESLLLLAKQAGCTHLIFSPDGYSDAALEGLKKKITTRQVAAHMEMLIGHPELNRDTTIVYSFLLAPPGETLSGLLKTLWVIVSLKIRVKLRLVHNVIVLFNWIRLEPETGVYEVAVAQDRTLTRKRLLPPVGQEVERVFYIHPQLHWVSRIVLRLKRMLQKKESDRVVG